MAAITVFSRKIYPSFRAFIMLISLGFATLGIPVAQAQSNPSSVGENQVATQTQKEASAENLAPPVVVNGSKITAKQVDDMVKLAMARGAKDTAQLRQTLLDDLIVKEIILQEVQKTHLTSQGDNELKIRLAAQTTLVDLWFAQYFASHPVTEADIKAAYDKDVEVAKDPKNANEYQLAQILVASESEANNLIGKINNGASFEVLAKEYSLDKTSGAQGGLVGWVLPSGLVPSIANVVSTMAKGKVTSKPLAVGANWAIIKVEDTRPFNLPSYDALKTGIAQNLIAATKRQAVENLLKTAKITQGK